MLPDYTTRNNTGSRGDRLVENIIDRANKLNMLSEIDFAAFLAKLGNLGLALPKRLGEAANVDLRRLQLIDDLLREYLDCFIAGFRFIGVIHDGTISPYPASRGEIVICNTMNGDLDVTLPDPALPVNGLAKITVKIETGPHCVIVTPAGGGTVDGAVSFIVRKENTSITFSVQNGEWKVV